MVERRPADRVRPEHVALAGDLIRAGWRVVTWTSWDPVPFVIDYRKQARLTDAPWGVHLLAADERADLDALHALLRPNQVWGLDLTYRPLARGEIARIERLRLLEQLDLAGSALTDDDLATVRQMTNLLQLGLADTGVTDAGIAHLADLAALRTLNLVDTAVTDECVDTLVGLPQLKHVVVAGTAITATGVERLATMPTMGVIRCPRIRLPARLRLMWRYRHVSFL